MKSLPVLMAMAVISVALAGCGRKASPQPPPNSVYPMRYPATQDKADILVIPKDIIDPDDPSNIGAKPETR